MKDVERYYCGNGEGMFDDKKGGWVEYKDYKNLLYKYEQALNIPPVIPRFYKLKYSLDFLENYVHNMSDNLKNNRGVLYDLTKLIKWNRNYNKSNEV